MSSKFGRLRQWAGEVISSKEKTTVHEDFLELEKDIELRKDGLQRLLVASEGYHHALSKKKASDSLSESEKLLPVDILGVVMINHGEEFGEDSSFGSALVKLGRAHCKVAALQSAYALTFKDTFLNSIGRFKDDIKEYENLRKKLDSRRLTYDAAITKHEKVLNNKKEKDKREAEEELERAKQRYDEMAEDLRAHIYAVQENEHNQLHELTSLLALETNFVRSYLDVLLDVKEDWQGATKIKRNDRSRTNGQNRPSRTHSVRSNGRGTTTPSLPSELSDGEQSTVSKYSTKGSKSSSRSASRLSISIRRNHSSVSAPSGENEKHGNEKPRRMSVAGWASSAVDSVTGNKGKKSKDTEAFATLDDGANVNIAAEYQNGTGGGLKKLARSSSKSKSRENIKAAPKILKPRSMQGRKVVRALYDFSGSTDELSFKSGDEIVVLNEVLDDWWMGEVGGQKGLFAMSYTEAADSSNTLENGYRRHDDYLTSDVDEDGEFAAAPMSIRSPFYGNFDDAASSAASLIDDDDGLATQPKFFLQEEPFSAAVPPPTPLPQRRKRSLRLSGDPAQQSLINGATDDDSSPHKTISIPTKKQPPPPPPRRPITNESSSGSSLNVTPASSMGSHNRSPFESATELEGSRRNPFRPKGVF